MDCDFQCCSGLHALAPKRRQPFVMDPRIEIIEEIGRGSVFLLWSPSSEIESFILSDFVERLNKELATSNVKAASGGKYISVGGEKM